MQRITNKRKLLLCFLMLATILILYYNTGSESETEFPINFMEYHTFEGNRNKALVYSEKCVIPDLPVFSEIVKKYYQPLKYYNCSKYELLTRLTKKNGKVELIINKGAIQNYTQNGVTCCYSYVRRMDEHKTSPDSKLNYTDCVEIIDRVTLKEPIVMAKCKDKLTGKEVYKNAHTFVNFDKVLTKIQNYKSPIPIKVLLIAIDSVSRLNLKRMMPLTDKYLQENDWIEYQGYNKIDDNTFPNMMAMLTGRNSTSSYRKCHGNTLGSFDDCDLIWYEFGKHGFITGYGEDSTYLSTFNYGRKGFRKQPMDYYFRPYFLVAEDNYNLNIYNTDFCAGPETAGERLLNIIKDFTTSFKNDSTFGFFWLNTFSHNDFNHPAMMDEVFAKFLLSSRKLFKDSIVIFFSDHGIRFGQFRYTTYGWYEERLPFLHFWIPKWFRDMHPQKYKNLKENYNKLTTPYDMYLTLQDLLKMHDPKYVISNSSGCRNCHSLFEPITTSRGCEDAQIPQHYCTCVSYKAIDKKDKLTLNAVDYLLKELHSIVTKPPYVETCTIYDLKEVLSVSISTPPEKFHVDSAYLLLKIVTVPEAVFEATLHVKNRLSLVNDYVYKISGDISRLDAYAAHAGCVNDVILKKYCYCKDKSIKVI